MISVPAKMPAKNKTNIPEPERSAKAAHLLYVTDTAPGIQRLKKGKKFTYLFRGQKVTDKKVLERIRGIVIPPAWTRVWICTEPNGHIQATGFDIKNRKQYRYHPLWNDMRTHTKFNRLLSFGEKLPQLRLQLEKDLARKELGEEKVLATVIGLMERTYIRIGNSEYEKANGSYGLTTLKDRHVKIEGSKVAFSFTGKKGIAHQVSLSHRRLAHIVKQCREIPGKELFQYYDKEQQRHSIDSGKVNSYIRHITGEDFTAKDFRTWAGTLNALRVFMQLKEAQDPAEIKKNIGEMLEMVSQQLGNTKTVCRKYYVHPLLISLYENQTLTGYLKQLDKIEKDDDLTGWTSDERLLIRILRAT